MKVWITKYALSKGIVEAEGTPSGKFEGYIYIPTKGYGDDYHCKPDWHDSEAEAVLRMKEMVEAKIVSLQKQLAKMNGLLIKGFTLHPIPGHVEAEIRRAEMDIGVELRNASTGRRPPNAT